MRNFRVQFRDILIIFIFLLYVRITPFAYVNNTYYETNSNLTLIQTATYNDETILVLLTGKNDSMSIVFEFRLIFPNGTLTSFSANKDFVPDAKHVYQLHPLKSNYFILGDAINSTSVIFSLLDWNGNILEK